MYISHRLKKEISEIPQKNECCRHSFLLGIFCACEETGEGARVFFPTSEIADFVSECWRKAYTLPVGIIRTSGGRNRYSLSFPTHIVHRQINKIVETAKAGTEAGEEDGESEENKEVNESRIFRCAGCRQSFVRGAFLACGSQSDPAKEYYIGFEFPDVRARDYLGFLLESEGVMMKKSERGGKFVLYAKNYTGVSDLLAYMGCNKILFECANTQIEKDLRNMANRQSNYEAANIKTSVDASQKHIAAIKKLKKLKKFDALPADLRQSAELRLENDDLTLDALGQMMTPPISKSGMYHRMKRLMELSDESSDESVSEPSNDAGKAPSNKANPKKRRNDKDNE